MATPASGAWHRKRSTRSARGGASSFSFAADPADTSRPLSVGASEAHATPAPSALLPPPAKRSPATLSRPRAAAIRAAVMPEPRRAAATRAHVLLAKAAQAGALFFTAVPMCAVVLALALLSVHWPHAGLARPAPGVVAYVQSLVRLLAAAVVCACVVVFHATTLANLRVAERSVPAGPAGLPVVYSTGPALRNVLSLSVAGALQVPATCIVVHGFRISRVVRQRVAPSWLDLQLAMIVGACTGVAFSASWLLNACYVLRVSPGRLPWTQRVAAGLAAKTRTVGHVLLASCAVATITGALMPVGLPDPSQHSVRGGDNAALMASAVEGAAAVRALDFPGLKRWWICIEAAGLTAACWTLSSVIVSVLLTQPYNFVLEAQTTHDQQLASLKSRTRAPTESHQHSTPTASKASPAVLDELVYALNIGVNNPSADPTGVLGVLAAQDLCDNVSTSPSGRAPVFADAQGFVWYEILSACLSPMDRLSQRLWKSASPRKLGIDSPSIFAGASVDIFAGASVDASSLYRSGAGVKGVPGKSVPGKGVAGKGPDVEETTVFCDAQRIVHGCLALSRLLVASRHEDRFGVAQRTLVDTVACLLQCQNNVANVCQTTAVHRQAPRFANGLRGKDWAGTTSSRDERVLALIVLDALDEALVDIVSGFHEHLKTFLDGVEPRWDPKFNSRLSFFLSRTNGHVPDSIDVKNEY